MRCRLVVLVRADATSVRATGEGKNQAVLICGESGAGKTECCKFVLAYLIAKKESTVERLDEKLMATNDPLEAFGNAKTVNNDNSSRFAKCMQICLDAEGRVIGAEIQTSLLEKGRSCAFFQQERNFHIFYMLCYYRHEGGCHGDEGEDTDTSDAQDMLGDKAYKYIMEADKYDAIRPGDDEVDTTGTRYRDRFRASDIDWFKRVIKSFRVSLGYKKKVRYWPALRRREEAHAAAFAGHGRNDVVADGLLAHGEHHLHRRRRLVSDPRSP